VVAVVVDMVGPGTQANQKPQRTHRKEILDPEQEVVGSLHTLAGVEVGGSDLGRRIAHFGEVLNCLAEKVRNHCLALAALDR